MTTVRSVTARLNADVDKYVTDMRRAGRETDKAFRSMATSVGAANRELGVNDIRTQKSLASTRQLTTAVGRLDTRLGRLPASLGKSSDGVRRLGGDLDGLQGRLGDLDTSLSGLGSGVGRSTRGGGSEIDRLSGRVRILVDTLLLLGPAAVPIGALAVPAITGLASQLGFAAAAGGTAMLAFQGVGDTVEAMNKAAIEPTTENLMEVEAQLSRLSPQAATFARGIGDMRDVFIETRDAAAGGLFSELNQGLPDLEGLMGRLQPVLAEIGSATGEILADGLASLNSDRWQPFFDFLQTDARAALGDIASAAGDFAHGLSEMWMAFQPLNNDFGGWLADTASGFDDWAAGLSQTDGFQEFIAYVRDVGPQVGETLGAVGGALLDIAEAAAPFGGPVLAGLEAFADVISIIADSPVGPVLVGAAAGMAALNRSMAVGSSIAAGGFFKTTRENLSTISGGFMDAEKRASGFRAALSGAGRSVAPIAGLALASSDLGDKMGATALSMTLIGGAFGPIGAAAGAAAGTVMEFAAANDSLEASVSRANNVLENGTISQVRDEYQSLLDTMAQKEQGGSFLEETLGGGIFTRASERIFGTTDAAAKSIDALGQRISAAEGITLGLGDVLGAPFAGAAASAEAAAMSTQAFIDAATRLDNYLSGQSSLIAYEQALDDLGASLKENGDNFNIDTQAGRDNSNMLINATATAIEYARGLKGFERVDYLKGVRRDLNGMVGDIPGAEKMLNQINRQLDRLGAADIRKRIRIEGAEDANGQVQRLRRGFDSLPRDVRTAIRQDGIPESMGQIRQLQRRYDLTPAQVRTLMELQAAAAIQGIGNVQDLLRRTGNMRPTPTVAVNDQSSGVISGIIGLISRVQSKSVTITTVLRTVRVGVGIGAAAGLAGARGAEGMLLAPSVAGPVRRFDDGGVLTAADMAGMSVRDPYDRANGHTAEISRSGVARVFREEETGGEAYIPLRNDHRRVRAKAIVEETAGMFGGAVEWNARGSVTARRVSGGGGGGVMPGTLRIQGALMTPFGLSDIDARAQVVADRRVGAHAATMDTLDRIDNGREWDDD